MLVGRQLRLRRVIELPGGDHRRVVLAAQQPRAHGGAPAQDVPDALARVHVAEVRRQVDVLRPQLRPLLLVQDDRILGQGERPLASVVARPLPRGSLRPAGEGHVPQELDRGGLARRGIDLGDEPLALQRARHGLGRRDRFRGEDGVLQGRELLEAALVVEDEVQHVRHEALALGRVLGPGQHGQVRVGAGHRLLQRAIGPEPEVEPAALEMARPAARGGLGHAGHLGGPARPELHVVDGLRAVDDAVLGREVHDQAIGLEAVVALRHLHPAQELQQAVFLGRFRPRGLDQRGRIVLVLDLEVHVLEQLEPARLRLVGEPVGGPGEVLPLELRRLIAADVVPIPAMDELLRPQLHAVVGGDVNVAQEGGPLQDRRVDPLVRGDGRLARLAAGHVREVDLHALAAAALPAPCLRRTGRGRRRSPARCRPCPSSPCGGRSRRGASLRGPTPPAGEGEGLAAAAGFRPGRRSERATMPETPTRTTSSPPRMTRAPRGVTRVAARRRCGACRGRSGSPRWWGSRTRGRARRAARSPPPFHARPRSTPVDSETQALQPFEGPAADGRRVLADAAGEGDRVHFPEHARVGRDVFLEAVAEHVHGQARAVVAFGLRLRAACACRC